MSQNAVGLQPTHSQPLSDPHATHSGGIEDVIAGGYCIGCGGCAAALDSPYRMELTEQGMFQAKLESPGSGKHSIAKLDPLCPFSDRADNEDTLGQRLFGDSTSGHHEALGHFKGCYGAHVEEGDFRNNGSSGGMGSWLQCKLLEEGLADYVINVKPAPRDGDDHLLFQYSVCSNSAEVRQSSKSRYYPVEMSEVLRSVREKPGRYVLVGLPCFLKAARLLCQQDAVLNARLKWFVGLVCGHLKSKRFAEYLAWQLGVPPSGLESLDFRKKLPGRNADDYGVEVSGQANGAPVTRSREVKGLDGCDWGRGYFKYKACDFCDDVLAETADVVIGDAWLPQFSEDWRGTNVVVTRNLQIDSLIRTAGEAGQLQLAELGADDAARSQDAGLRHRREGLRYRLALSEKRGEWHPTKRLEPSESHLSNWNQARHRLREAMRDTSHQAFAKALEKNDITVFQKAMQPHLQQHAKLNKPKRWKTLRRLARWLLRRG